MRLSRRHFVKLSGGATGGFFLYGVLKQDKALAFPKRLPLKNNIGERTTVCPYCTVSCGAIMAVEEGKIINIEGDPEQYQHSDEANLYWGVPPFPYLQANKRFRVL